MSRLFILLFITLFLTALALVVYFSGLPVADRQHLATIAALEVGANDCEGHKGLTRRIFPVAARTYFSVPGVAASLVEDGGSFIFAGVTASVICSPNDRYYAENLVRAQKSIERGLRLGEPVDRQWVDASGYDGFYPTHYAAIQDQLEILKFLVEKGADLTLSADNDAVIALAGGSHDIKGLTPLQMAERLQTRPLLSDEMLVYLREKTPQPAQAGSLTNAAEPSKN